MMGLMTMLETERLVLRRLTEADAAFILELVNEPGWLRFIGNRRVHTLEDARAYVQRAAGSTPGYGFQLVARKADDQPLGICGLIKRPVLEDADLGFAFLSQHAGQGYAREAATGVLTFARDVLGLSRVVAVTMADNDRSIKLLEGLGMRHEGMVTLTEGEAPLCLYGLPAECGADAPASSSAR